MQMCVTEKRRDRRKAEEKTSDADVISYLNMTRLPVIGNELHTQLSEVTRPLHHPK